MDPSKQPGIQLGQVVVERALFQHRADYLSLDPKTPIEGLPLTLRVELGLSPNKRQGAVRLSVETDRSKNPVYILDAAVVGVVQVVEGQENMPLERFAAVSGGALLMPFVRELVANLTSRGRFGPIWLHPVNFAASTVAWAQTAVTAESSAIAEAEGKRPRRSSRRRPKR